MLGRGLLRFSSSDVLSGVGGWISGTFRPSRPGETGVRRRALGGCFVQRRRPAWFQTFHNFQLLHASTAGGAGQAADDLGDEDGYGDIGAALRYGAEGQRDGLAASGMD